MVTHESEIKSNPVYPEGGSGITKQILAGPRDGYNGFLRKFSLKAGGHSPYHHHNWSHLVYVLEGSGKLNQKDGEYPLKQGSVVYLPPNEEHNFQNTGEGELVFLCLVPDQGDSY